MSGTTSSLIGPGSHRVDYGDLVDREGRDDLDAVVVATHLKTHHEIALAALEKGKHVLCEKPMAESVDECKDMDNAARENDLILAVNFNTRVIINDDVWHHLATILPEGANDRSQILLFIDGKEASIYGHWGTSNNLNTGTGSDFQIGKRWDNGQRFVGAIDDVRLYSADFSEFEIQKLVKESSGLPVDLGEDSYTLSVWAKPTKLTPVMDYKFAMGWYEGNVGEYMQAKLAPGRVDETEYNSMYTINPTDSDQATNFPYGLSEKIFDGSFGDIFGDTSGV